jgi:alkylation response protein AidB-like acyl-CoA dehydrogenase
LRHRVADMKMQLELGRSMSYYATPEAQRRPGMSVAAAMSARQVPNWADPCAVIGQRLVQLHGGIGVTDEYIVSHYFKKLTQLEMTFGDSLAPLWAQSSAQMQDTAGVFA